MNHFFHFMNKMLKKKGDTKNLNGYNRKLLSFRATKWGKRAKKIDNPPDGVSNNEKVTDGWRRNK